jgi:hypothetical protein
MNICDINGGCKNDNSIMHSLLGPCPVAVLEMNCVQRVWSVTSFLSVSFVCLYLSIFLGIFACRTLFNPQSTLHRSGPQPPHIYHTPTHARLGSRRRRDRRAPSPDLSLFFAKVFGELSLNLSSGELWHGLRTLDRADAISPGTGEDDVHLF